MYFRIYTSTCRKSIHTFGKDATLLNAQQECNELAIAINKLQERDWIGGMTEEEHAKALDNLHEEIADVLISIVNVLEIYKLNKFDINNAIEHKQTRQNQRIREFLKEY